jgi:hypothetical protein
MLGRGNVSLSISLRSILRPSDYLSIFDPPGKKVEYFGSVSKLHQSPPSQSRSASQRNFPHPRSRWCSRREEIRDF